METTGGTYKSWARSPTILSKHFWRRNTLVKLILSLNAGEMDLALGIPRQPPPPPTLKKKSTRSSWSDSKVNKEAANVHAAKKGEGREKKVGAELLDHVHGCVRHGNCEEEEKSNNNNNCLEACTVVVVGSFHLSSEWTFKSLATSYKSKVCDKRSLLEILACCSCLAKKKTLLCSGLRQ